MFEIINIIIPTIIQIIPNMNKHTINHLLYVEVKYVFAIDVIQRPGIILPTKQARAD